MTTPSTPSPEPIEPVESAVRGALRAAAPVETHVDAGLTDLRARVASGATASAPTPVAARRLRSGRTLAIAAAVAVVLGLVAVAVGRSDDGADVTTVSEVPQATGWYIPEGLSEDWALTRVSTDFQDVEAGGGTCTCRRATWIDESAPTRFEGDEARAAIRLVQVTTEAPLAELFAGLPEEDLTTGIELGGGITATAATGSSTGGADAGSNPFVAWQHDGIRTVVTGSGLSERRVIDAARGVVEDAGAPPLEGFDLVDQADVPAGLISYQAVHLVLENTTTGALVAYVLVPPGFDPLDTSVVPEVLDLPGAPGPLLRVESTSVPGGDPSVAYLGPWPGASVFTDADAAFGAAPGPVTDDDVREVLGSLHPATAEAWAAYLDTATEIDDDTRDQLQVASLQDLTEFDGGTRPTIGSAPDGGPGSVTGVTGPPARTRTPREKGPTAADLEFRPVLSVAACAGGGAGDATPSTDGTVCYELGPKAADGTDLREASADLQESWVISVRAKPGSVDALNDLFNRCFDGDATCPPQAGGGPGAIAIVFDRQVISAPAVNGRDLADDAFTISADFTQGEAEDLAAVLDQG